MHDDSGGGDQLKMGTTTIKKSEADKAYRESDERGVLDDRDIQVSDIRKKPRWLLGSDNKSSEPKLNGVTLDHLRKVRGEEEDIFECHKYDLTMEELGKLTEGCKQKGIEMRIMPFSQYWPNHTIAIRFEQKKKKR
ncbi:MAG: hypothetical protein ACJ71D_11850 [Nitrososphaera sp.]